MAIHITKDLVLINVVKGTLGPVSNIPITAQARQHDPERFAKASSGLHSQ
jgi:hypothetical protein